MIKNDNKLAFEAVFKLYYQQLCVLAYTILKEREEAEEIVQEAFVKIWERRHRIELKSSIRNYMYSTVRNSCFNYLKHQSVERDYETAIKRGNDSYNLVEEEVVGKELNVIINKTIEQLPEKRREIFELSRYEGLKYSEIAERLNISIKTVEAQMGQALKYLKTHLRDYLIWVSIIINIFYN